MLKNKLIVGLMLLSCLTVLLPNFSVASSKSSNNAIKKETVIFSNNSSAKDILQKKINNLTNRKAVEVTNLRSSNEKHFRLPDGKYEAVVSPYAIHYLDENNEYQNINTTIVAGNRLSSINSKSKELRQESEIEKMERKDFRAPRVPFDVVLPQTFNIGYSISKGNDKIEFIPQGGLDVIGSQSAPSVITYKNAWDNTDVSLEVLGNGLKETIILKNNQSPQKISYEVIGDIKGNLTSTEFSILPAWMEDSKGTKRTVNQSYREADGKKYIDFEFDLSGLVYPITIDPTTTTSSFTGMENGKTYSFDVPANASQISAAATVTSQDYSQITSLYQLGTTSSSSGTITPSSRINTTFPITNFNVRGYVVTPGGFEPGDPPPASKVPTDSDSSITATSASCFSKDFDSSYVTKMFEIRSSSVSRSLRCELFVDGVSNSSETAGGGRVIQQTGINLNVTQNISLLNGSFKLNNSSTTYTIGNLSGTASKVITLGSNVIPGKNSITFNATTYSKANMVITYT
ncbi:hypothetical protein [Paenibacillus sp. GCM10023250]|uniref:hypothetical protein n=1 Tax=Paenibacillus sp. GCM10023250 TaxID=3252648 RepID=UPI0036082265